MKMSSSEFLTYCGEDILLRGYHWTMAHSARIKILKTKKESSRPTVEDNSDFPSIEPSFLKELRLNTKREYPSVESFIALLFVDW